MGKINDHPLPVILGALASLIGILYTIFVFTTGKPGIYEEPNLSIPNSSNTQKSNKKTDIKDTVYYSNPSKQNILLKEYVTPIINRVEDNVDKKNTTTEKKTNIDEINYSQFLPKKYVGYIKNTTFTDYEQSSFCEIELNYDSEKDRFHLKGKTDNVNLFGTWDLEGIKIIQQGKQMVHFTGKFDYGIDVEGNKVITKMSMLLDIEKNSVLGTYGIAPIEEYGTNPEKGTLELH